MSWKLHSSHKVLVMGEPAADSILCAVAQTLEITSLMEKSSSVDGSDKFTGDCQSECRGGTVQRGDQLGEMCCTILLSRRLERLEMHLEVQNASNKKIIYP